MQVEQQLQPSTQPDADTKVPPPSGGPHRLTTWINSLAGNVFIWPAVLVVLFLSIFPLITSLYISLTRLKFVPGGFEFTFVGLANYRKLVAGSEKTHFLGVIANPSPFGWFVLAAVAVFLLSSLVRYVRSRSLSVGGLIGRIVTTVIVGLGAWLLVGTLSPQGRPGTLIVTLIYVLVGIVVQYLLGLGLALLTTQRLPGRRFFRVVFLLPMMITPVGIAYTFRMLTDTSKGPFGPIWQALGLGLYSWVTDPWGARAAVLLGDIWQWTPFTFIVLLAALESLAVEPVEAALVDGANRWQIFWHITVPYILPVSTTLILIRMIEAFKIVDMPNVLTNGGPGTATESLTLHSFIAWRSLDLGGSAAIAYTLLFVVTFVGMSYVNLVRSRVTEEVK
jgi:multiple sugar transport system permease protein